MNQEVRDDVIPVSAVVEIISHLTRERISGGLKYYMHFQSLTLVALQTSNFNAALSIENLAL